MSNYIETFDNIALMDSKSESIFPYVNSAVPWKRDKWVTLRNGEFAYSNSTNRAAYILDKNRPYVLIFVPSDSNSDFLFTLYSNEGGVQKYLWNLGSAWQDPVREGMTVIPADGYEYAIGARNGMEANPITDEVFEEIKKSLIILPLPNDVYNARDIELASGGTITFDLEPGSYDGNNLFRPAGGDGMRARSGCFKFPFPVVITMACSDSVIRYIMVRDETNTNLIPYGSTKAVVPGNGRWCRMTLLRADGGQVTDTDLNNTTITVEKAAQYDDLPINPFSTRMMGVFTSFTVIGDSLACGYTSRGGTTYNSATAKAAGNNWPTYLQLELGRPFTNVAVGGSTARDWRNTHVSTADVDTNCYLIGLGVNDCRQSLAVGTSADIKQSRTDNADTFYGNYDYVIREVMSYNPTAHVFVFTIPATETNGAVYNEAIRYVANLYSRVHLIDIATLYADEYGGAFLSGSWDGHSTPMGYMYMAAMLKNAINDYMLDNYTMFFSTPYK